ncbi:hypothetical protein PENANT_c006G06515 [Penicillium antarcticum]|uniref:Uncharacterized protein n=1 Tax=Penicillium antarcticum TaxID=416450 RepID=A0A1V6QDD0_9EURO|nr:uncharacterized protein N7508_009387 [Penicillium antarcticum]KAJ5294566.1 hypothetical protein N7508_009387 [Penicillium antarcticum]OQD87211.1 hypothetical protein PENANT_c006G06515 [Penicillium antarcticum]
MNLTPRSQTGNNLHDSRKRHKRPRQSPIKPESPDENHRFPKLALSMGSHQNDLVPPSGLHRLPRPPTLPNPLPPPPAGWQGEQMTEWLRAKAEEDRRKQAEERTQQESLILEQRRIEQSMLADCLRAGVPPHFLPLIFAAFQHTSAAVQGAATVPPLSSVPEFQHLSAATRAAQAPAQSQPPPQALVQSQTPSFPAPVQQQSYQGPISSMIPPSQAQQPAQAQAQPVQQSPGFRHSFPIIGPDSRLPRSTEPQGQSQSYGARYMTTAPPHFPPPPSWAWDYRQPPPLSFHHWTPPESLPAQSQSQSQSQNPTIPAHDPSAPPKPPASTPCPEQNSPVHKRKDERPHQKVPPPSSRIPDSSTRRQDSSDSSRRIWSQSHRRQTSDVSSTGAHGNDEGESSEQHSELTPVPTDLSSIHNTSDSARGTSQSIQDPNVGSQNASSTRQ